MAKIYYVVGDATKPIKLPAVIPHICNDVGKWGSGFVVALSERFGTGDNSPEGVYREYAGNLNLGDVLWSTPTQSIIVANMIAQHSVKRDGEKKPLRIKALHNCLDIVYTAVQGTASTIHMCRIGTDRAGSTWEEVEPIIRKYMTVDTYVYDLHRTWHDKEIYLN